MPKLSAGREGLAPTFVLHRHGSYGDATDPELPVVSTLDRSKAMQRVNSSSESRSELELLPDLDIALDWIGMGERSGQDGVREASGVS